MSFLRGICLPHGTNFPFPDGFSPTPWGGKSTGSPGSPPLLLPPLSLELLAGLPLFPLELLAVLPPFPLALLLPCSLRLNLNNRADTMPYDHKINGAHHVSIPAKIAVQANQENERQAKGPFAHWTTCHTVSFQTVRTAFLMPKSGGEQSPAPPIWEHA